MKKTILTLLSVIFIFAIFANYIIADEEIDEVINVGDVGVKQWNVTVVYHSNFRESIDAIYTVQYCFKSSSNSSQYSYKSFDECGFELSEGYKLTEKYWNTKRDGTGKSYAVNKFNSDSSENGKTIHLYAQYISPELPIQYNVKYYIDDTLIVSRMLNAESEEIIIEEKDLEGKSFDYWKTNTDERYNPGDIVIVNDDISFYAVYTDLIVQPDFPSKQTIISSIKVKVVCKSEPSEHKEIIYPLANGSFEMSEIKKDGNIYFLEVKITNPARYILEFDDEYFSSHKSSEDYYIGKVFYDEDKGWFSYEPVKIEAVSDKFTVRFKDGVSGSVFKDIVYDNLSFNDNTPVPDVSAKRPGYEFVGWDIEISDFVYDNAVYTALWRKIETTTSLTTSKIDNPPKTTVTSKKKDDDNPKTSVVEKTSAPITDILIHDITNAELSETTDKNIETFNNSTNKDFNQDPEISTSDNTNKVKIKTGRNFNYLWILIVILIIVVSIIIKVIIDKNQKSDDK